MLMAAVILAANPVTGAPRPQDREPLSPAEVDQLTAEVAAQLRCPVCRNQAVLESSSGLARQMQTVIREKIAAGETPEQVKAYFVSRYGGWILLKPEPRGINLLVYLLPAAAVLFGGAVLFRQMRRWTGSVGSDEPAPEPPDEALSEEEEAWLRRQIGSAR